VVVVDSEAEVVVEEAEEDVEEEEEAEEDEEEDEEVVLAGTPIGPFSVVIDAADEVAAA
jgi:hypothetical protein